MTTPGLVLELQRDCLDTTVSAAAILRKAKVIALKLSLNELRVWIDSELNGYTCSFKELPSHRKGGGQPKFFNPYHGWCPIQTADDWWGQMVRTVYFYQSISELEHFLGSESGSLVMTYPSQIEQTIQSNLPMRMQVGLHFSKSEVIKSLDFVRNKSLEWTLELEQRGIRGEGMTFGESEKEKASAVTNNIYGGNFGVLGSVSGGASNSGFISVSGDLNVKKIQDFLNQVSEVMHALPQESRDLFSEEFEKLREQANSVAPVRAKVVQILNSMRAILEGASGNIAAQGILTAIASLAV